MASQSNRARPQGKQAGSARPWSQAKPAPIVLVSGPESLLAARAVSLIVAAAKSADPEVDERRLDASTYDRGALMVASSPSLFGGTPVVVVSSMEAMNDAFLDDAMAYAAAPDPSAVVVLLHGGGNRGKRLLDDLRARSVPEFACPAVTKDAELVEFVRDEFSRSGRSISPAAARGLVDSVGADVSQLAAASAQLMTDVVGDVADAAVAKYFGSRVNATGFAVADAAVTGKRAEALALARHALETGTDPVPLVAALASKLRTLAKVGAARGRGLQPSELGLAPWQVDRATRDLRHWDADRLAAAISAVAEADHAVKGAHRSPAFAVEKVVRQVAELAADVGR